MPITAECARCGLVSRKTDDDYLKHQGIIPPEWFLETTDEGSTIILCGACAKKRRELKEKEALEKEHRRQISVGKTILKTLGIDESHLKELRISFGPDERASLEIKRHGGATQRRVLGKWGSKIVKDCISEACHTKDNTTVGDIISSLRNPSERSCYEMKEAMNAAADMIEAIASSSTIRSLLKISKESSDVTEN